MGIQTIPAASGGLTQKTQVFTSTGSFVTPANTSSIEILIVGGGGGGGSATNGPSTRCSGGGGAGGQVKRTNISVVPGTTYTVTVGAGGAGGTGSGAGSKGSDSSFGAVITATGGSPGGGTNDSSGTYANSTIISGWNQGAPGFGPNNIDQNLNAAGGSGGPATWYQFFGAGTLSVYSCPVPGATIQGYSSVSLGGSSMNTTNIVLYAGAAVEGLYGGGGCGGSGGTNNIGAGVGQKTVIAAPNAGNGGNYRDSGVSNTGTAGTANFGGGGGAGSVFQSAATTVNGGAGGSGYVEITYWS